MAARHLSGPKRAEAAPHGPGASHLHPNQDGGCPDARRPRSQGGEDLLDPIGHRIGPRSLRPALDEARAFLTRPVPRDPEAARGQPWLVNALCTGACFDNKAGRDRSRVIEVDDVYAAREELVVLRRTHLDQLAHKLEEARVRRVVEPILSGGEVRHDGRDLEYVRDLGLLAPDSPPRIANPIYAEVVPRELGYVLQDSRPNLVTRSTCRCALVAVRRRAGFPRRQPFPAPDDGSPGGRSPDSAFSRPRAAAR